MSDLWAAIAIVIILEGVFPFLSPSSWKQAVSKMIELPDRQLRIMGGGLMLVGLILLSLVR